MKLDLHSRDWNIIKMALLQRTEFFTQSAEDLAPVPLVTESGAKRMRDIFRVEATEALELRNRIDRHDEHECKASVARRPFLTLQKSLAPRRAAV
jgi:hypothetical protein